MSKTETPPSKARPWWSYGMVWMVIAGPAIVVVAGFYTYYLAVRMPDPVLSTPQPVKAAGQGTDITHAPALQGRNHAATGELPAPTPDKKP